MSVSNSKHNLKEVQNLSTPPATESDQSSLDEEEEEEEEGPPARKVSNFLLGLCLFLALASLALHILGSVVAIGSVWVDSLFALCFAALMLANLSRRLPFQNALGAGGAAFVVIFIILSLASRDKLLAGIVFTNKLGLRFFGLFPIVLPFLLTGALLASREAARVIMRPWRRSSYYGYWIVLLASVLFLGFDFLLESFATQIANWWSYPQALPESGMFLPFGVPILVHLVWFIVGLVTLILCSPWLLKRKVWFDPLGWHVSAPYLLLCGWLTMANLVGQQWLSVLIGVVYLILVIGFSAYGIRVAQERLSARFSADEESES